MIYFDNTENPLIWYLTLLFLLGPKWRNRRKMITPAFHRSILEQYIDCFDVNGRILIEQLEKELDKDSVDIYPYISLYTLDVICVINARRKELEIKPKTENGIVRDWGEKKKMDFLDILLQSSIDGEPLSREDIREEGHDTSSSAISFTVFLLANHPEVQ
ncbi:hypothetical protein NQ314_018077, partial [Rhamnusium bicolor]